MERELWLPMCATRQPQNNDNCSRKFQAMLSQLFFWSRSFLFLSLLSCTSLFRSCGSRFSVGWRCRWWPPCSSATSGSSSSCSPVLSSSTTPASVKSSLFSCSTPSWSPFPGCPPCPARCGSPFGKWQAVGPGRRGSEDKEQGSWRKIMEIWLTKVFWGETCHFRFQRCSLLCWGAPTLLTAATAIIEFLPKGLLVHGILAPDLGLDKCFFSSYSAQVLSSYLFKESCYQTVKVAYFHGPLAVLLTINLVLFLSSAYSLLFGIWAIPREDSSTSSRGSRQMFWIVLELFLVLGLTWLADVISLLLNWANGSAHVTFEVFVFDAINALQGFFTFMVLVCKSRIRSMIRWVQKPQNRSDVLFLSIMINSIFKTQPFWSLLQKSTMLTLEEVTNRQKGKYKGWFLTPLYSLPSFFF